MLEIRVKDFKTVRIKTIDLLVCWYFCLSENRN